MRMRRWLFVLAYNTSGNVERPEVSFWSVFVHAKNESAAYADGARVAQKMVPQFVAVAFNDYTVEIPR